MPRISTHHNGPEGWGGEDDGVKFGEFWGLLFGCQPHVVEVTTWPVYPAPPDRRPWLSNVTAEGRSNLNGSVLTWRASVSEQREEDYDANEGCCCVLLSPRDIHRELNSLKSVGLPHSQMSVNCSHRPSANSLSNVGEHFSYLADGWDSELTP